MELQGKDPSPSPTRVHGTSKGDIPNSHFQDDKILTSKVFWHVPKEDYEQELQNDSHGVNNRITENRINKENSRITAKIITLA